MKFIFIFVFSFSSFVVQAANYGTFFLIKGDVQVEYQNGGSGPAKINAKVSAGDTVITSKDSRAKIVIFGSRNIINILPNTKLKIMQIAENKISKTIQLNLIEGKIRPNVGDKFEGASRFEIRTSTASIGVRGTQFVVSHSSATQVTEVLTLRGVVSFTNLAANQAGQNTVSEVLIKKGQKSTVGAGTIPTEPVKVDIKEYNQINIETNVEKDSDSTSGAAGDAAKGGDVAADDSGGFVNINPIATPNTLPVKGVGVPQRRNTPVKINIK